MGWPTLTQFNAPSSNSGPFFIPNPGRIYTLSGETTHSTKAGMPWPPLEQYSFSYSNADSYFSPYPRGIFLPFDDAVEIPLPLSR
ncbi:hypothetical protein EJ06DRAFT_253847 [Trichodelitschia bisporula]|uniref:Uncharacterized protein n=1 Tax=Trichodelitschia bisporula TaxID=703511 RepID=A0A6G1HJ52_9PEZI|nr:hypothetical protein EJ06DRAFT_253847 [Trichodelitschia bisporula]